ncbi:hypothetical protein [Haladaptatus sp. DYSN1]|uniref:hypothetical protein n=1 Tax=unclassified Haladaptatus TaxID=2622732 RepID=UPI0024075D87|nr:hypothetical protein [Haladaptatus sp. DYSN1]
MQLGNLLSPGIATAIVAVILVFSYVARHVDDAHFHKLGTLALCGHFFVALVVLPLLPYKWDIDKFHNYAVDIMTGVPVDPNPTVNSFAGFQSLVYTAFGANPTIIALINGLLAVLISLPIIYLARRLYPGLESRGGVFAAILFFPLPFLFLTIPMRDALNAIIFFSLLAIIVRAYDTRNTALALPAIPLFGMLALLRPELAFITLGGTGASAFVVALDRIAKKPLQTTSLSALFGVVGLILIWLVGPKLPIAEMQGRLLHRTSGGAAYLEGMTYDSWVDLILVTPTRALYFQFAPFPLHVSSAFDLLGAVMTPLLIILAVAGYRSARAWETDRSILVGLTTTYLLGIVGYGLIDSNFGTTIRHRIPFTFLLVVFAAPVIERWASSFRNWVSQRPRDYNGHDEQQRKTEKLDCGVGIRTENAD